MQRGFDSLGRFLLKGMKHPEILPNLHCINHSKGVSSIWQGNLHHSGTQPQQWFSYIRLTALGRYGQSCDNRKLSGLWKPVEILAQP